MTTADILESLTDRSRFELLATSVLRKSGPKYAAVIHTGVNAQGETIVAPIDGLHLIPHSSPPHYVFVQHTTTDRGRLRGKWLSNNDSDLPKAVAEAAKVRKQQPQAIFTIVLSTNQRVDPQLALDVHQQARAEQVAVDIWEQSRFSDFLDTTSDGHWLRKCYLAIEAERLSADLLHQLGRRSFELYQQEFLLTGHGQFARRDFVDSMAATAVWGGPSLCLLTGPSGYGKTVATAQLLDEWLSSGHLGLWLPARFLWDAMSLEGALNGWLRSLHPTIQPDAGGVAIELARKAGRILICIDDINRTPEAARLLRLALCVAAPAGERQGKPVGGIPHLSDVLCQVIPVWPEQLTSFPQKVLEKPWVRNIVVGDLLPDEASELIRKKVPRLSHAESCDYAARLNHDPFLVGLFTLIADEQMDAPQLVAVADDAIGQFLDTQFRELCSPAAVDFLPFELLSILTRVAHEMIQRRNLRPSWAELEQWLGDEAKEIRGLRAMVPHGRVCRLDVERRLDFRHDRLREWFLVQAMTDLLQLPEPPGDIITDPYYSAIVGKAVARAAILDDGLARLRDFAPWTLFEAVRQVAEPLNEYQESLFQHAQTWAAANSRSTPDSIISSICWTLIETNSSRVLPIIDALPPNYLLMAAGLRNGSVQHGMRYFRSRIRNHFEPGVSDDFRDRLVEHAGHRHREQLIRQLRFRLSGSDLELLDVKGYLALLGHFQFAGFDQLILETWQRYQDEVLAYAIWAAARCPLQDVSVVLGPMLSRLWELPVRNDNEDLSDREWMSLYLGRSFRRGVSDEAMDFILQAGRRDQIIQRDVAMMVEGIDHPDAMEFLVRHLADGGGSNLWSIPTGIGDGEPEVRLRSLPTTERLRGLWQSADESGKVRTYAFCLWLKTTGCDDPIEFVSVEPDSPFYAFAVQHRIKLGDLTIVPELLQLLRNNDLRGWWWMLAHRVWCEELQSLTAEELASFHDKIPTDFSGGGGDRFLYFANLLVKIPVVDGETLLQQHWGHLKYCPRMIHSALRIGTPGCAVLAREALSICPADVDVFHLAFSTVWEEENAANPITIRHLVHLEPYLDRMSAHEILFLAWGTERVAGADEGIAEWIRTHAVPRLPPEDQARVQVSDQTLVSYLNRNLDEKRRSPSMNFLFDGRGGRRYVFPTRQVRLLDEWLSKHRTVCGLQLVAECLKYIGARVDLCLLSRYTIDGDDADIQSIVLDARFSVFSRTLS